MQIQPTRQIVKIRERGQMTIPEKLRELFPWLQANSVIEVIAQKDKDVLVVRPISKSSLAGKRVAYRQRRKMSWEMILKNLAKIRASGDQKVNLSEFLIRDRESRKNELSQNSY